MSSEWTSVGLDVHARSVVAAGIVAETGELKRRRMDPDNQEILEWLSGLPSPVQVVYEAGPTGFGLARFLNGHGVDCVVAAPSKLNRPAGDRVKTDARDALLLARLLRMGEISEVRVPSDSQEAARDLVRAREDCRGDLMRARHRVSKLLLRRGIVYSDGKAWTMRHDRWLRAQSFDDPSLQLAFDSAYESVLMTVARRKKLDAAILELAADCEFTPVVRRLCCLRGISTLTGLGLAVEIGDWERFTGATIGAFCGLVPTENSSGGSRSLGSITKTGNAHVRRLLVESAWHHKKIYNRPGAQLQSRWQLAPPAARARGHAGNQRLNRQWMKFTERKKKPVIANVAVARELAGWCWSLAVLE
jgi:transposase